MIRHRNYYAMVQKADEMEDRLTQPGDVMLLYLPLAHNYGRLLHLSAAYTGFTTAFLPDPLRAGTELKRVRPHLFPSVPRVYEKIHTAVVGEFADQTGAKKIDRRLGDAGRLPRREASAGEAARSGNAPLAASRSPTSSSTRRSRPGSADGCESRTRAARLSRARSRSSSTRSTS